MESVWKERTAVSSWLEVRGRAPAGGGRGRRSARLQRFSCPGLKLLGSALEVGGSSVPGCSPQEAGLGSAEGQPSPRLSVGGRE